MFHFICGVLFGILLVILLAYLILFSPLNEEIPPLPFVQQFQALRFPKELKKFLETTKNTGSSESEKCFCISLLFHFLFQELKDTRRLRRWFHKRLQLELHDLTTRSTAGRLIQDIRIRDISVGSQFPVINSAKIESYQLSDDGEGFESLNFLIDLDYAGGFEASIDVFMVLGRFAQFSIHVSQLRGKARLFLTRQPFTHWAFAFVEVPQFNFKIDSQWQGRQIKHLIPLITQQIRRAVQRKLVWPNYKIRYRPFFPNPFFTPSLPIDAFSHIKTVGGLEVTILQCTRLNVSLAHPDHDKVYCSLSIDQKPFSHGRSSKDSRQSITVLIDFVRHDPLDPIGLTLSRSINELGARCVQISSVADESSASKSGFKPGDIILAVNNVPIRTERQANKLLCSTAGELGVLVERSLSDELNVTNHQIHRMFKLSIFM
ncbi:hypothetical protein AB6A40_009677 [Gnathostoma spinigerum]|uniref:PDZ domain-containing protein n=1 Tax=Gnathostoma spinigerum TaxID=75299 RepID=A0ABD6ET18_9BILA